MGRQGGSVTTWTAGAVRSLAAVGDAVLMALLPPRCHACDRPLATRVRHGLCESCLVVLGHDAGSRCRVCDAPFAPELCDACAEVPPPFAAVVAPYVYGGVATELVTKAKFSRREDVAVGLARLVADDARVRAAAAGAQCLVPVPLGRRRRRERGFNQSAVMARVLGRALHLPVVHALVRTRDTAPQSELPLASRRANVHDAFRSVRPVTGTCLLVDDVVTSGETARQAAAALRDAGAGQVIVIAAARTPVRD